MKSRLTLTITLTLLALLAACQKDVEVISLAVSPTQLIIAEGEVSTVSASVFPEKATDKTVIWSSSNEDILTVDQEGNVIALKSGMAIITARSLSGGVSAICVVNIPEAAATVTDDVDIPSIEATGSQEELPQPTFIIEDNAETLESTTAIIEYAILTDECSGLEGALNGEFSVSSAVKVRFSRGNLWSDSTKDNQTWAFEDNQYDYQPVTDGEYKKNHVSHFFWSDKGNYGSSLEFSPTADSYVDWGIPYCESNGLAAGSWRTLTREEWTYLFIGRQTSSGMRYAKATLSEHGKVGMILFPDEFVCPSGIDIVDTDNYKSSYGSNSFNAEEWSRLESAGVVFLPAAGLRSGSGAFNVGTEGQYWSSTQNVSSAYCIGFADGAFHSGNGHSRFDGLAVRLVAEM